MKIYRVQDKQGRGPWKPGFSPKWVRSEPDHELVPWYVDWLGFDPRREILPKECVGCGCATIYQLRRWFNHDEYQTLRILGYRSVEMEVDRILRQNEKQLFARRRALRKGVRSFELY